MNLTTQNAGGASALIGLSQNAFGGLASPIVGLFGSASYAPMATMVLLFSGAALALVTRSKSR
ncbi:hypothetical protein [Secundilactobacillus kimchicus]|nr:hypothetical protein [Secundilactobacillus kimchicus]